MVVWKIKTNSIILLGCCTINIMRLEVLLSLFGWSEMFLLSLHIVQCPTELITTKRGKNKNGNIIKYKILIIY